MCVVFRRRWGRVRERGVSVDTQACGFGGVDRDIYEYMGVGATVAGYVVCWLAVGFVVRAGTLRAWSQGISAKTTRGRLPRFAAVSGLAQPPTAGASHHSLRTSPSPSSLRGNFFICVREYDCFALYAEIMALLLPDPCLCPCLFPLQVLNSHRGIRRHFKLQICEASDFRCTVLADGISNTLLRRKQHPSQTHLRFRAKSAKKKKKVMTKDLIKCIVVTAFNTKEQPNTVTGRSSSPSMDPTARCMVSRAWISPSICLAGEISSNSCLLRQ